MWLPQQICLIDQAGSKPTDDQVCFYRNTPWHSLIHRIRTGRVLESDCEQLIPNIDIQRLILSNASSNTHDPLHPRTPRSCDPNRILYMVYQYYGWLQNASYTTPNPVDCRLYLLFLCQYGAIHYDIPNPGCPVLILWRRLGIMVMALFVHEPVDTCYAQVVQRSPCDKIIQGLGESKCSIPPGVAWNWVVLSSMSTRLGIYTHS